MIPNNWNGRGLKVLAGVVASVGTIVGTAFMIDARYAHAADIAALRDGQAQLAKQTREETRYAADILRKQLLEDRIFELTLVSASQRTSTQRALLERYRTQVLEINARWPAPPSEGR